VHPPPVVIVATHVARATCRKRWSGNLHAPVTSHQAVTPEWLDDPARTASDATMLSVAPNLRVLLMYPPLEAVQPGVTATRRCKSDAEAARETFLRALAATKRRPARSPSSRLSKGRAIG
jgi:hypothetical protein